MQLDVLPIIFEPLLSVVIKPMTSAVVDDDKQLLTRIFGHQLKQELMKCMAVENRSKTIREVGILK